MVREEQEIEKKLNNKKAIELVEKYKVLEGKYELEKGFLIHKIFAVPTEYYLKCKSGFGFNEMWNEQYQGLNRTLSKVEYDIVALHKMDNGDFLYSTNLQHLEKLYLQHSKNI